MNRGVFQSSPVQQQIMMGGSPGWWTNLNSMRPPPSPQLTSSLLPPPSPSSSSSPPVSSLSSFPQLANPSTSLPLSSPWHDNQELPESWSQLLLGGLMGEEERCSFASFLQQKKADNWEGPVALYQQSNGHIVDVKQERSESGFAFGGGTTVEEIQATRSPWSQLLPVSSPNSCVTSFSGNTNMLDFASSNKADGRHPKPDHSSECNSTSTGSAFKKARVQGSSTSSGAQSTFKVRKEKLGDRITALHQLVSPFGKTDTASVLLEAIGYIRFLQNQIEALSTPYLGNARNSSGQGERGCIFPEEPGQLLNDACLKRRGASADQKEPGEELKKDLSSRGLCLVPISCTMHVGSDNGADFWAPTLGGGFR